MLYPDFNDLVALKDLKLDLTSMSRRSSHSIVLGGHHSPFRGQGLEFDFVRKYVPGDDIRNIDWRVTARTDSPHLKIFREERERNIFLCVDMNAGMRFGTKKTFKSVQAAHIAAILGWRAMAAQDRISACLYGDVPNGIEFFAPARTRKSFSTILRRLSEPTQVEHKISLEKAFQHINQVVPTGALIYFISDFLEIEDHFREKENISRVVKKCDIVFISVNDQADKTIHPSGVMGFCLGNEKISIDTDSVAGKEAYERQWKENRKTLHEMTMGLRIPLIELSTESDLRRDLVFGLKGLSARKRR